MAKQLVQRFSTTPVRSTTASGSVVYESQRAVDEYLQMHYGRKKVYIVSNL